MMSGDPRGRNELRLLVAIPCLNESATIAASRKFTSWSSTMARPTAPRKKLEQLVRSFSDIRSTAGLAPRSSQPSPTPSRMATT